MSAGSKTKTQTQTPAFKGEVKEVEFKDVVDFETQQLPTFPNLIEALNKTIVIEEVTFRDTNRGRVYYIKTADGNQYYTWSKVVGRQLEELIDKYISKGIKVRATVRKVKNYLTLAPPR